VTGLHGAGSDPSWPPELMHVLLSALASSTAFYELPTVGALFSDSFPSIIRILISQQSYQVTNNNIYILPNKLIAHSYDM